MAEVNDNSGDEAYLPGTPADPCTVTVCTVKYGGQVVTASWDVDGYPNNPAPAGYWDNDGGTGNFFVFHDTRTAKAAGGTRSQGWIPVPKHPVGPGRSPVSWRRHGATGALRVPIEGVVERYAQAGAGWTAESGFLTDRHPFGAANEGVLLTLVRVPDLRFDVGPASDEDSISASTKDLEAIARAGRMDMSLVLDQSGQLIAAYSDPKETWVLPMLGSTPRDPEAEATGRATIGPLPPGTKLRSSIAQILGQLRNIEVNPGLAGQVVLRPRLVTSPWPPTQVDGEWVPNTAPRVYWLVQVLGMDIPSPGVGRPSSMIFSIADDDYRVFEIRYMP
jgi:hypothetical protein